MWGAKRWLGAGTVQQYGSEGGGCGEGEEEEGGRWILIFPYFVASNNGF